MRLLFALLVLLCAGPSSAASLKTYEVHIADGAFSPPAIDIAANQRIKIKVKNVGKGPAEFENLSLRVEKVLAADVESFVIVPPLKPGQYKFVDEFHMDGPGFNINVK